MTSGPGKQSEGFNVARLLMVLSSLSPMFILLAIRGTTLIRERWFLLSCGLMVVLPIGFLGLRIRTAKNLQERREIVVGKVEDHRAHLLTYLFAVLLPFYRTGLETWRDLVAMLVAMAFIVFVFFHLNLHYLNLLFAAFGYRVFTVYGPVDPNPLSSKMSQMLITPRVVVSEGDRITAYRLSDTVYIEVKE